MQRTKLISLPQTTIVPASAIGQCSALALSGLLLLASMVCLTANAIAADVPATRVLQGGTEATEYIMEGVPKYRDAMMAMEKKDYAAAEALFKAGAAQLGQGHERSRAECLYHQAGCLELLGKADDASNVYKAAVRLFDQYDPGNPMKAAAIKSVRELPPEKTGIEKDRMMVAPPEVRMQTAIKPTAELNTMGGADIPVLDVIDERTVPQTVLKSFVEMSCIETAELGANASNVAQRWQPLMVQNEPAAFTIGAKFPTINVTVNKRMYQVPVSLPGLEGLHKILLVTNKEKICAIDFDTNESWLLRMKPQKDGTVSGIGWSKLTHIKPGQPTISRAPAQDETATNWGDSAQNPSTTEGDRNSSTQIRSVFSPPTQTRQIPNGRDLNWNGSSPSRSNSSAGLNTSGGINSLSKNMSRLEDLENQLRRLRSGASTDGSAGGGGYQRGTSDQGGYGSQNGHAERGGSSDKGDSGF